jgi:hypothetical protein
MLTEGWDWGRLDEALEFLRRPNSKEDRSALPRRLPYVPLPDTATGLTAKDLIYLLLTPISCSDQSDQCICSVCVLCRIPVADGQRSI